jgi:hypothetical protein
MVWGEEEVGDSVKKIEGLEVEDKYIVRMWSVLNFAVQVGTENR